MYREKSICIVIPAYNEEKLIGKVIETMPDFVDRIIVVDDRSRDHTVEIVHSYKQRAPERIIIIGHEKNQGVGGSIVTGYKWARDNNMDVTCVMAGDAQMNPDDLIPLIEPVISGEVDYTKGNRLFTPDSWNNIPKVRFLGNSILSLLTKIASGYWHVADTQCGYTAVSLRVLRTLDLDNIYRRFGVPNDILVRLNVHSFKVRDIQILPVYRIGEKSAMWIPKAVFSISWLLLRRFFWRLKEKYIIRDFHPLVFFYTLAIFLILACLPLGIRMVVMWIGNGIIPKVNALALMFSFVAGLQSLFFAMWFDMEYNRDLR